jgi:Ca-activated chloride channel family protein
LKQKLTYLFLVLSFIIGGHISSALAQSDSSKTNAPLTRILFLFDASNSMNGQWQSSSKIRIARKLLSESMDSLKQASNIEVAMRVYGHQTTIEKGKQDCNDTKLEIPFAPNNFNAIKTRLKTIVPKGTTPIARSLEKAAYDFPKQDRVRNIIILITDGLEACDEDPCAVSKALQSRGVILKPFIIGIGLDQDFIKNFECVGNYYDAADEATFRLVLRIVLAEAVQNTTAQVDLLDTSKKPTETNVPIQMIDQKTGELKYHYTHTLNHLNNPDTILADALYTYKIVAQTIPPVTVYDKVIEPGEHNTFVLYTPQGTLDLKIVGRKVSNRSVDAIVRQHKKTKTLHVQAFDTKENYITGLYDLEILTYPRIYMDSVVISQSEVTDIAIPQAGLLNVSFTSQGFGAIYEVVGDELVWVLNFNPSYTRERYFLQPGKYKAIYRSKNARETLYTKTQHFNINSGSTFNIRF